LKGSDMAAGRDPSQFLENFLFPNIFRAFRMAVHPRKIVIAFVAVVLITSAGWLMDLTQTVVTDASGQTTELHVYVKSESQLPNFINQPDQGRTGVFSTLHRFGADRFHDILSEFYDLPKFDVVSTLNHMAQCIEAIAWTFKYHSVYAMIFFAVALAVIALAGGAICRMAALQLAQNERPGLIESLRFSGQRFISFFSAPLLPLVIIIFLGSSIFLLGLLGNLQWVGELLVALGMPLVLLLGVLMMLVALGTIGGLSLMYPTVAYEYSDSFIAVNNSFRFVFSRPWRMAFYAFMAGVYGAISYGLVRFFTYGLLLLCYRFLQLGFLKDNAKLEILWTEPSFVNLMEVSQLVPEIWTQTVAAFLVRGFVLSVVGLMVAFVFSYYFTVNTIIYALMRQRVDSIPISDIHSAFPEEEDEEMVT